MKRTFNVGRMNGKAVALDGLYSEIRWIKDRAKAG